MAKIEKLPAAQVWKVARLKANPKNARVHPPAQIATIRASLRKFGFTLPLLVDEKGIIIAGHGRLQAALDEGMTELPVIVARGWSEKKKLAYMLVDNKVAEGAVWDQVLLSEQLATLEADFDMKDFGFDLAALDEGDGTQARAAGSLSSKFFAVPFSVLNAREGWWQDRKRAWLSLGIQSEIGRGENLLKMSDTALEPDPKKRAVMQARRARKEAAE